MKKIMVFHASKEYFTFENFRSDKVFHIVNDFENNNIMWLGAERLIVLRRVSEKALHNVFSELVDAQLNFYYPIELANY